MNEDRPDHGAAATARPLDTLSARRRAWRRIGALTFDPATDRPTTITEQRPAVGDAPLLALRRQK